MYCQRRIALSLLALGLSALGASRAHAQAINFFPNGVLVDAEGVLHKQLFEDPTGQLTRQRIAAARAKLSKDIQKASKLRLVSLTRLEAAVKARHDKQSPPTDEMLHLAGLTRVRYVFFYPDTNDVVIGGPAEGWVEDLSVRAVGFESGRPVLELQDLVAALRAFAPTGKKAPVIMCSIDPTKEGLERMQNFLRQFGSRATPDQTETIVNGLRTSLGMQDIRVAGVAAETHFAQVLIEADYRMKLIGIGLEKPAVKLASYVDRANPSQVSRSALQRWYFVPEYKCVRVAADDMGMELVGDGVKLVGEDQLVNRDGSRRVAAQGNKASQAFVDGFTKKYAELAAKIPVYAQLRNCIDLAVAAAFIQQHDYYKKAGWPMDGFASEKVVPIETLQTPVHVETVVASVWRGSKLMTPVGGGVHIEPREALASSNLISDEDGQVSQAREKISLKDLAADQWWWDAN